MASERNVLTWLQALRAGWEPSQYQYTADAVPVGKYEVMLDFKIWAKKVMAINCYYTVKNTGAKVLLTVYCQQGTGLYQLKKGAIDFTNCPTGTWYAIEVIADQKKKIRFIQAALLGTKE